MSSGTEEGGLGQRRSVKKRPGDVLTVVSMLRTEVGGREPPGTAEAANWAVCGLDTTPLSQSGKPLSTARPRSGLCRRGRRRRCVSSRLPFLGWRGQGWDRRQHSPFKPVRQPLSRSRHHDRLSQPGTAHAAVGAAVHGPHEDFVPQRQDVITGVGLHRLESVAD